MCHQSLCSHSIPRRNISITYISLISTNNYFKIPPMFIHTWKEQCVQALSSQSIPRSISITIAIFQLYSNDGICRFISQLHTLSSMITLTKSECVIRWGTWSMKLWNCAYIRPNQLVAMWNIKCEKLRLKHDTYLVYWNVAWKHIIRSAYVWVRL